MRGEYPPIGPWRKRWFLTPLLPYSMRTDTIDAPYAQVTQRFLARNRTIIAINGNGLLVSVKRQYRLTATSATVQIAGPYGYKAWTMQTTIAVAPAGQQSVLTIRTHPHYRVTLTMIAALVLISVFTVAAGMPSAPLLPLILFTPLLYGATVAATKIEATAIAGLVRRVAGNTLHSEGVQGAESYEEYPQ